MIAFALDVLRVVNVAAAAFMAALFVAGVAYVARWILTPPASYTPPEVRQ